MKTQEKKYGGRRGDFNGNLKYGTHRWKIKEDKFCLNDCARKNLLYTTKGHSRSGRACNIMESWMQYDLQKGRGARNKHQYTGGQKKFEKSGTAGQHEIPPFTMKEFMEANKDKKAPGLDNLPAEVIKAVVEAHPEVCLRIMNNLLAVEQLPKEWKTARLVPIEKGKPGPKKTYHMRGSHMRGPTSQEFIKYLDIHMDRNMRMGTHVRKTAEKAGKVSGQISRLSTSGDPEKATEGFYAQLSNRLCYTANQPMEEQVYRNVLLSVQRGVAIRNTCTYRTASTIDDRKNPFNRPTGRRETENGKHRSLARRKIMDPWQQSWDFNEGNALWTRRLISDEEP
ncbi:hypothetical protein JTB14_000390 [Gonioctena quinquepunctata]|nr:hypothetical protein JTB14_000390 [Gonioctena quinquepunctata]